MTDPKNTNDSSVHSEDFTDGFLDEPTFFGDPEADEQTQKEQIKEAARLFTQLNHPYDY